MLLGKRQRPPTMKRTTSLSEITFDLNATGDAQPSDPRRPVWPGRASGAPDGWDQQLLAAAPPRVDRRHSADFRETPNFLRCCSLCKRRLIPGRDIYMYKGDSAFCSLECRQQQMNQDERKDKKCSVAASKKLDAVASSSTAPGAKVAAKGETVATV
ncbi:FCS-Like Zinc finger 5-like [Punica granatum]|uniref:FLZ-type domain-containing protein n=2 Tax=Punica granatum TaxID=22663 RepID=A0A218X5C4_PUNGR|nr:FCS-Like Zinc finger 5-like [Punica granatum]OWM79929.1 hypothetical protein CDL15_Pgr006233 [Punica granatum]PKI73876.1 hypothetical protein CRG98_005746 [Punica granatum]